MPDELNVPPLPAELAHLWGYFQQLNAKRTCGAMFPNPLSDEQILGWQRRHRIWLTPFEGECIDALDLLFLINVSKSSKTP